MLETKSEHVNKHITAKFHLLDTLNKDIMSVWKQICLNLLICWSWNRTDDEDFHSNNKTAPLTVFNLNWNKNRKSSCSVSLFQFSVKKTFNFSSLEKCSCISISVKCIDPNNKPNILEGKILVSWLDFFSRPLLMEQLEGDRKRGQREGMTSSEGTPVGIELTLTHMLYRPS